MGTKPTAFYAARDRAVEKHIGAFGGTTNVVVSELFLGGPGKPAGDLIKALERSGRCAVHSRILPGGHNLVTLTPAAAAEHGYSAERAKVPQAAALSSRIARLCFCCLSESRRYVLEPDEVEKLAGFTPAANVPYVLGKSQGEEKLLRLYRVSANKTGNALKSLRAYIEEASEKIPGWLSDRDFGIAVLCPTSESRAKLDDSISKSGLRDQAFISVHEAPDAEHYNSWLKKRRGKR